MSESIITAFFLGMPVILAGSFHMLVVSRDWFAFLARPINLRYYGANKTWRGIVVMLLATIPGTYLAALLEPAIGSLLVSLEGVNLWLFALALGLGYVIPELPNSYIKRRLNIKPGERSEKNAFLFAFMDQADSAVGCIIVYWIVLSPPLSVMVWMVLLGPIVHAVVNVTLFSIGLRKQPF
jgi:CDP-diglyceride synthetase